jgi:hypothetical protein
MLADPFLVLCWATVGIMLLWFLGACVFDAVRSLRAWVNANIESHTPEWHQERVMEWIKADLPPLPPASEDDPDHPAYTGADISVIFGSRAQYYNAKLARLEKLATSKRYVGTPGAWRCKHRGALKVRKTALGATRTFCVGCGERLPPKPRR